MKWLYKSPILFYRLGLGSLVGRLFMVMTTIGRKSGRPRRTAIEFHEFKGRKYVFSNWGMKTDWYQNIERNPCITIQTWRGAEGVLARRISSDEELKEVFEFARSNPSMRVILKTLGIHHDLELFMAQKDRFMFVTFDPTDQAAQEPLSADLVWTWYILLPFALFLTMGFIFQSASQWIGKETGYLMGFVFYWLVFGLGIPAATTKGGLRGLLRDRIPLFSKQNWIAALLWGVITFVTLVMYAKEFISAPWSLILLSIPLAVINGICEEILWRGMYVQAFPRNPWLGIVFPAFFFALWHFIPLSVFPVESDMVFISSTFLLGLAYGFIAYRTGSAKWTAISHSVNGVLALSGMLAPSILSIIRSWL
jgi:deazaflavin-dependent oxidoreductase (nitroreductase family)